jgi:hypothetical protein
MKTSMTRLAASAALSLSLLTFIPQASAETVITESVGTISEFSPDALVIRSETATAPARYVVSKEVTYVDEAGAPVDVSIVRSGAPVTVHYIKEGDRMIARKVVVRRAQATAPVIEKRTTTTTTTTTAK